MPYGMPLFQVDDTVMFTSDGQETTGVVRIVNARDTCRMSDDRWEPDASYDIMAGEILVKHIPESRVHAPGRPLPSPAEPVEPWRDDDAPGDRILFCGDIHDKGPDLIPLLDYAIRLTNPHTVVLLGDLLNEWGVTPEAEIAAFTTLADWVEQERHHRRVGVLLGNHDLAYWLDPHTQDGYAVSRTCPGFNPTAWPGIHERLIALQPLFAFGFTDGEDRPILASHAGFTADWTSWLGERTRLDLTSAEALAESVNTWAFDHPHPLGVMVGPARGGMGIPSPLWADAEELARDPLPGFDQIVGHTPQKTLLARASGDNRLFFCDTHSCRRDGQAYGDDSLFLYDRANGEAWNLNRFTAFGTTLR